MFCTLFTRVLNLLFELYVELDYILCVRFSLITQVDPSLCSPCLIILSRYLVHPGFWYFLLENPFICRVNSLAQFCRKISVHNWIAYNSAEEDEVLLVSGEQDLKVHFQEEADYFFFLDKPSL